MHLDVDLPQLTEVGLDAPAADLALGRIFGPREEKLFDREEDPLPIVGFENDFVAAPLTQVDEQFGAGRPDLVTGLGLGGSGEGEEHP
jgi:hypothetical protein